MNVARSLLEDIKTKQLKWYRTCTKDGGGESTNRSTEMAAIREKETKYKYKSTEAPSTQLCCLLNIEDSNFFGLKDHHQVVDFNNK
jgi:hypothetical protein